MTRSCPAKPGEKFCKICLSTLPARVKLSEHECKCKFTQTLRFPEEKEKVQFRNFAYTFKPSHLCFFDFETLSRDHQNQSVTWKHESLGHAYLIVNRQGDVVERKSYTGSDAVNHFISHLSDTWRNIKATAYKYPINMTPGWKTFPQSEAAWTLPSPNQWQAETTKASRPQSSPEKLHWSILHAM